MCVVGPTLEVKSQDPLTASPSLSDDCTRGKRHQAALILLQPGITALLYYTCVLAAASIDDDDDGVSGEGGGVVRLEEDGRFVVGAAAVSPHPASNVSVFRSRQNM